MTGNAILAGILKSRYNGFRILSNGVLVRRLPDEEKTGSIFIPEMADTGRRNRGGERMAFGEILAVGDGHPIRKGPRAGEKRPLTVQPGERILFVPCPPNDEITVDGEKLWVVHEDHVLGVVE